MRVIWAYCDQTGEGKSPLHVNDFELYLLLASVHSWIRFCGSAIRVFYVDKSIYELLVNKNIIHLWDKVEIVDFRKDLFEKHKVSFFAYPKIWAMTRQTEPFWIMDTDAMIRNAVDWKWFGRKKMYCSRYTESYCYADIKQKLEVQTEVKRLRESLPAGDLWSEIDCHHGGIFYFPDPKVAKILGYAVLSAAKDLDESYGDPGKTYHRFEEGIILSMVDTLLGLEKNVEALSDDFYLHISVEDTDSVFSRRCTELNKSIILNQGLDIRTQYAHLFTLGDSNKKVL